MRARRCASPGTGHARQSGTAGVQAFHGKPGGVRECQAIQPGVGQALWLMPWALATQPRPPGASSWCARPSPGPVSAGTAHPAGKGAFCKHHPTKPGEARPSTKRAVVPLVGRDALPSKPSHTAGGHARRKGQASVASRPGARLGPPGRRHARGRPAKRPASTSPKPPSPLPHQPHHRRRSPADPSLGDFPARAARPKRICRALPSSCWASERTPPHATDQTTGSLPELGDHPTPGQALSAVMPSAASHASRPRVGRPPGCAACKPSGFDKQEIRASSPPPHRQASPPVRQGKPSTQLCKRGWGRHIWLGAGQSAKERPQGGREHQSCGPGVGPTGATLGGGEAHQGGVKSRGQGPAKGCISPGRRALSGVF